MWLKPILICPSFLFTFWRPLAFIILFFDLMFIQNPPTMLDSRLANWAFLFLHITWCCILVAFSHLCKFPLHNLHLLLVEIVRNKLVMHLCPSFSTRLHNVETNLSWKSIRFVKGKGVWKEERKLRKCKKCQLNCNKKKYQVCTLNDHNWLLGSSLSA